MGRDFTNFEEGLKNSLEGYEVPFNQAHWDEMSQKLDGKKASSISTLAASVVTAMILAGGAFYFATLDNTSESKETTASNTIQIASEDSANKIQNINPNLTDSNISKDQPTIQVAENSVINLSDEDFTKESSSKNASNSSQIAQSKKNIKQTNSNSENTTAEKPNVNAIDRTAQDVVTKKATSPSEAVEALPSMTVSHRDACAGEFINFIAENIDENQNFLWNFGNGDFSTDVAPERKFDEPGEYNVTLILSGTAKEVQSKITIHPKPEAKFSAKISEPGEIVFENQSKDADKCTWLMEDKHLSNDINPVHIYTQGGSEHVTLMVENQYGCTDVEHKDVLLTAPYIVRNTPDNLSSGKFFKPTLDGITSELMSLQIMNLNSQLIYETVSSNPSWDGTYPDGTYPESGSEFVWLVKVLDENGNEIASDSGQFTIIP